MNFNDLVNKNSKVDQFIEEKTVKSKLELLEEQTDKTVKLLSQFTEQIPLMVEKIEKAGKYIEMDSIQQLFTALSNNMKILIENQNKIEIVISNFNKDGINILNQSNELLKQKSSVFKYINWLLVGIISTLVIFIFIGFRRIENYSYGINKDIHIIHNILKEDVKYWYDENNNRLLLKKSEKE